MEPKAHAETVGERVLRARTARKLSQAQVAGAVGVSSGYLSLLERSGEGGIKVPGIEKMRGLANVLGVPFDWLAFGEGDEPDLTPDDTSDEPREATGS